jgi:hypothetical protein
LRSLAAAALVDSRPSHSLALMLKKKSTRILLPILFIVLAVFCAQGFIGAVHQTRTSAVERDFVAALAQLQNSPPGIGRVETFVARLRAIDTNHAPVEVKQALQNYASAIQQSVNAAKAGHGFASNDAAIAEARQGFVDAVREYD